MAKKRRKKQKLYFGKSCEDAIVRYNNSDDLIEKDKIYKEFIEYPFNKLAENIINRFKFPYFFDSTENIQKEVVSFLISRLDKYDQNKGRAFSYFSVVAKNYLIAENDKKYEHLLTHHSIDNPDLSFDVIDEEDHFNNDMTEFMELYLEFWDNNMRIIFNSKSDIQIADAVLELFRRAETIENFNKKGLYIFVRNMTDVKTQAITNVVNTMKTYTEQMLKEFNEYGHFDTDTIEFFE